MEAPKPRILFVDDVLSASGIAEFLLEPLGADVDCAESAEEALALLAGKESYDVVVSDVALPGVSGFDLIHLMRKERYSMPVIFITGYNDSKTAEMAREMGAFDFVPKPLDRQVFLLAVKRALNQQATEAGTVSFRGELSGKLDGWGIIGESTPMAKVYALVARVAKADSNVCIYGESGTGKELIARALHSASQRKDHPFIAVDCASIPDGLMENELFGHTRGAYTGASGDSQGVFELAHEGTLFLDEVGELGLPLQAKLLRVLQTREFRRIGGTSPIKVDVRVIAATNKDLSTAVSEKKFRDDLYYRLNVLTITLPPLRTRKEDIPLLVQHFIKKHNTKNRANTRGITPQAIGLLLKYDWPGNVRELENCIERAAVLADGDQISAKDLIPFVSNRDENVASAKRGASLRQVEQDYILQVLNSIQGNRTRAAQILGISVRGLQYKLKEYGELGDEQSRRIVATDETLDTSVWRGRADRRSAL